MDLKRSRVGAGPPCWSRFSNQTKALCGVHVFPPEQERQHRIHLSIHQNKKQTKRKRSVKLRTASNWWQSSCMTGKQVWSHLIVSCNFTKPTYSYSRNWVVSTGADALLSMFKRLSLVFSVASKSFKICVHGYCSIPVRFFCHIDSQCRCKTCCHVVSGIAEGWYWGVSTDV